MLRKCLNLFAKGGKEKKKKGDREATATPALVTEPEKTGKDKKKKGDKEQAPTPIPAVVPEPESSKYKQTPNRNNSSLSQ